MLCFILLVFFPITLSLRSHPISFRRIMKPQFTSVSINVVTTSTTSTTSQNPIDGSYDYDKWKNAFKSQPNEMNYEIFDIDGCIPSGLQGTLYRSMPALFEKGGVRYGHYLDGDGYVIKISINQNKAYFTSKFVETEEYQREKVANKILYRSTFRTQKPLKLDPFVGKFCFNNGLDLKLKNLANTNSIYWGGKLLTLYEAGVPYCIDPRTLDTIGPDTCNIPDLISGPPVYIESLYQFNSFIHRQLFGTSMTAHPKVDSWNSRFITWIWRSVPKPTPDNTLNTELMLDIHEYDKNWNIIPPIISELSESTISSISSRTEKDNVNVQNNGQINYIRHKFLNTTVNCHDFSITNNYYLFIQNRVTGDTTPYLLGTKTAAACIDILPQSNMILDIVPRTHALSHSTNTIGNTSKQSSYIDITTQVPLTPGFTIHSVCGFENDGVTDGSSSGQSTGGGDTGTLELFTTGWDTDAVGRGEVQGGLLGSWEGTAPHFGNIPCTYLYRTIVNMTTGTLISHNVVKGLENTIIEHPHIHPAFEGRPIRYMYMSLGSQTGQSSPPLGYLRIDLITGEKQIWYAPLHTYCEEVVIVPKIQKNSPQQYTIQDQEKVWILATMYDAVTDRSKLGIFDGENISIGPVCTLNFTHHLPHSLHGCFTTDII